MSLKRRKAQLFIQQSKNNTLFGKKYGNFKSFGVTEMKDGLKRREDMEVVWIVFTKRVCGRDKSREW